MRKLLVLLVLGAVGLYLYGHRELWRKTLGLINPALNQQIAAKTIMYTDSEPHPRVSIDLVDGNRWRVEAKGGRFSKTLIAICDGAKSVGYTEAEGGKPLAPKALALLDPHAGIVALVAGSAKIAAVAKKLSAQITEPCDGHECWRGTVIFQGVSSTVWVDTHTSLPVRATFTVDGKRTDCHFSFFDADFAKRSSDYFDTRSPLPLFSEMLTTAPSPNTRSATETGSVQRLVTLTKPAQFPVGIAGKPSGSITAPAGTRVKLVAVEKESVTIGYADSVVSVPMDSTDLLPDTH